jgi:16S rRNA (cytosine967-C5)-methyltransferase
MATIHEAVSASGVDPANAMSISPARTAAFDILLRIEREDAYASELLHSARYAGLSPADHGLATELVMGVLRWRSVLDQRIANLSSQRLEKLDPEVLAALRLAAYQLRFLDRVPQRAAVHESVELVKRARKRSAVPFVNAVLRKLATVGDRTASFMDAVNAVDLAARSAHPWWLVERWQREFGLEAARQICHYDQQVLEAALRLPSMEVEKELEAEGIELSSGRLLAWARRVQSGDPTKTRAFREKRVVIQDEASQLVALLAGQAATILDCCAAPGGKTRVLASRNPDAVILATEIHPHRARLMRQLVPEKNVQVLVADARQLPLAKSFERVLADVPCSGTGTLSRNPEIKRRLKPEDLVDFQRRQGEILQSAMKYVVPGGRLVYSTCSLESEENAAVVEKAVASDCSFRVLDCRPELEQLRREGELVWGNLDSLASGPYLRTIPGVHPCEGFFAAMLQKD